MTDPLKRYPRSVLGPIRVRPMKAGDEAALVKFFRGIPVNERRLFKDDVTQTKTIKGWVKNLDYDNILPLLAFDGKKIVADASLHREARGWSRHVAKIRITLDPAYRGRGLARALVKELTDLAGAYRISILQAEVLDVQKGARALFEEHGFQHVGTLPQHALDFAGRVHDILLFNFLVSPPERLAPEAALTEEEADVGGG